MRVSIDVWLCVTLRIKNRYIKKIINSILYPDFYFVSINLQDLEHIQNEMYLHHSVNLKQKFRKKNFIFSKA